MRSSPNNESGKTWRERLRKWRDRVRGSWRDPLQVIAQLATITIAIVTLVTYFSR
jgi:hypothetical protein